MGAYKLVTPPWEFGKGGVLEDVRFWIYKTTTSSWVGDRNGITKTKSRDKK